MKQIRMSKKLYWNTFIFIYLCISFSQLVTTLPQRSVIYVTKLPPAPMSYWVI